MEKDHSLALWGMGMAQVALRQFDEGIATLKHAVRATGRGVFLLGVLGWALAMAGRKEPARAVLEEFRARPESAPTVVSEAWLLAALGYKERAFRVLARAEQEYQPFILFPKLPGFDLLRADPRLPAMETRLGLPPLEVTS